MVAEFLRAVGVGLATVLVLSACAVGPNFVSPSPPVTQAYTREALPSQTQGGNYPGGEAQHFWPGRDLSGQWWTLFGSTQLNGLIEAAMANYPDIANRQAALRVATENVRAQAGEFFPQVQGTATHTSERSSGAALLPGLPSYLVRTYQASVSVSYALDVFGGERRTLEGLQAQAAQQNFQLEAGYLTLTSNVASTVIQLASTRDQIEATQEIIASEDKQLSVIERQLHLGSKTRADVLQQQSNLASVRATLPALQQQLAVAQHQLAVLTGRFTGDAVSIEFKLADLKLPRDLPLSLPSALVAQRPDIAIQEMLLHQASAAIGVATANMLPQLTLTGSYGGQSASFSKLLSPASGIWSFVNGVTQPIFEGGSLRAKRRAAIFNYEEAKAQYRLTVLQAFQNVADTLTALDSDAQALETQYDAVEAARASLDFIQRQYDTGAASYVSLLTAQQSYQQARLAYVRAIASRYTDTVTLFQALGGGWWNRKDGGTLQAVSPGTRPSSAR